MDTIQSQLNVPKETKEVIDGALDLIEDIRAKKDVGVIAAENLPSLMAAFDGYDKIKGEISSAERSDLVAYVAKRVMDLLIPVESEQA